MLKLNDTQISNLKRSKICFSYRNPDQAWIDNGIPSFPHENVYAEDYASFFVPTDFYSIGSFSYSWSPLPHFISVGRYCSIAVGVEIIPDSHPTSLFTTSSMVYDPHLLHRKRYYNRMGYANSDTATDNPHPSNAKDIIVGHDVYIGAFTKLRRGITVGDGAIIGAYSVVAKDVPPYAVVVGNPAKIMRHRYREDQISSLRKLEWWNFDFHSILNGTQINDIDAFIDRLQILVENGKINPFSPKKNQMRSLLLD